MTVKSRALQFAMLSLCAFALAGCSETELASHYAKKVTWPGQQENAGTYKVGNPYKVGDTWYYPQEDFKFVETGIASWYGPDFNGHRTANGEVYDQSELTAAHRTLPMPSLVRVTNLENGRSIIARINDRGPFLHGRIIDLSKRGAELLGYIGKGTARVKVEVLERESRAIANAAKNGLDTSRMTTEDIERLGGPAATMAEGPVTTSTGAAPVPTPAQTGTEMASAATNTSSLPDSLKTPTITVEELSAPGKPAPVSAPPTTPQAISGHVENGRFLPSPVVTNVPVHATGIFVQAGSFGVQENAERLSQKLSSIAPAKIETVTVNGRQMYRVKLGPISSVDEADQVLAKVTHAGNAGARVIRGQ